MKRKLDASKLQTSLTEGDVRIIRWEAHKGKDRRELAQEYSVSKQTIDRIIRRDTFAWVKDNAEDELDMMAPISSIEMNEAEVSFARLMGNLPAGSIEVRKDAEGEHIPTPDELYGDQEDELQAKKDL